MARVKAEAEPPLIKSENRLQEAQADQILLSAGVMSKESMAARHGLVYADERDKMGGESDGGHAPGRQGLGAGENTPARRSPVPNP